MTPAAPSPSPVRFLSVWPAAGLAALAAVCLIVFHPWTFNSNLIKEMIWWPGLLVWGGAWLLAAPDSALRRAAGAGRALWRPWRWAAMPWLAFGVWLAVGAARAPVAAAGLVIFGRFIGYALTAGAVAVALGGARARRVFLETVSWALAAGSLYVIIQSAGWDFLQWQDESRPTGTFGNPNFMANLLGAWLPVVLAWEMRRRLVRAATASAAPPWWRRAPQRAGLMLIALLLTESRAGAVSLLAGMSVLGAMALTIYGEGAARRIVRLALAGGLAAALIAAGAVWGAPERLNHALNSVTIQIRFLLWDNALTLWRESPWAGHGAGAFAALSPALNFRLEPIAGFKQADHAHSWFFEALMELGLIGAALLLAALAATLLRLVKAAAAKAGDGEARLLSGAAGAGLAALLAGTFFDVWLNWWDGGWTFALLLGLGMACGAEVSPAADSVKFAPDNAVRRVARWAGAAVTLAGLIAAAAAWNFWFSEYALRRGQARLMARQPAEALALMEQAAARRPASPDSHIFRANALMHLGRMGEAETALKILEKERPFLVEAPVMLARLHEALGRLDVAEAAQRRAWALEPGARHAMSLAGILIKAGQPDAAAAALEEQLRRQIHPEALHLYLKIRRETGHPREARDFLAARRRDPALHVHPRHRAELIRWEAELSALLDDPVAALGAYQEALRSDAGNFELWNDYGLTLKKLGRWARADAALARATALAPDNFAPAMNRLELALERGNSALARELAASLAARELPAGARARLDEIAAALESLR